MSNSNFRILDAVLSSYRLLRKEWRYLFGLALLPGSLYFLSTVFVQFARAEASMLEQFMWTLPSIALYGWFMFQQTRLIIFGERIDSLPAAPVFHTERLRQMRASVMVWMLFNMAFMGTLIFLFSTLKIGPAERHPVAGVMAMMGLGLCFWGIRFSIVHILAAVDYPIKSFVFRVNGVGISLRLIAMGLVAMLPLALALQIILSLLTSPELGLESVSFVTMAVLSCFFSMLSTIILNSASVYALKQMLGGGVKP